MTVPLANIPLAHEAVPGARASGSWMSIGCHSFMLPGIVILLQLLWFQAYFPQPLVYDAAQYFALSQQWEWWGILPTLSADGLRTYAYPVVIHLAGSTRFLLILQGLGLLVLMMSLRRQFVPSGRAYDVSIAVVCAALPVLVPYALVMLADLPGVVTLQGGLLCLSVGLVARRRQKMMLLGCAGFLIGWAIQLRPAYAHLVWFALIAVCVMEIRPLIFPIGSHSIRTTFRGALPTFVGVICFIGASLPTLAVQLREHSRLSYLPGDGVDRILGYHLMLGLSLDRWSSNPPPIEERRKVAEAWQRRGWAILPIPPNPYPRIKDFRREVKKNPGHAAAQFAKHIYHAFAKVELCPYQGHPSYWWGVFLAAMNWFVLSIGTIETIRRACYSKETCQRIFCALQLALLADLILTCALVVPEERFTLAVYPVFMIFTASAMVDVFQAKAWVIRNSLSA